MVSNLQTTLSQAWQALREGAEDPGSPWRAVTLATVGIHGAPSLRTLVLRACDEQTRTLDLHTDTRSAKFNELQQNCAVALHVWNPAAARQLRLAGPATLHTRDEVAALAWSALRPQSQMTYRVNPGPGTAIPSPGTERFDGDARIFCVIRINVDFIESLHLQQGSHQRARFTWENGSWASTWIVP